MNTESTFLLGDVAIARSGDKGNHANLGVVCRRAEDYPWLIARLTAQRVHDYFKDWGAERVERFELPNVHALNFVLYNALAGGASCSLRIDTQGKLLGTAAMKMPLPGPLPAGIQSSEKDPL